MDLGGNPALNAAVEPPELFGGVKWDLSRACGRNPDPTLGSERRNTKEKVGRRGRQSSSPEQ